MSLAWELHLALACDCTLMIRGEFARVLTLEPEAIMWPGEFFMYCEGDLSGALEHSLARL